MSDSSASISEYPADGGETAPPGRILIVDDEAVNRMLLSKVLAGMGHAVIETTDGPAALDAARRCAPDLALVDVMMDGMDGFEVCERLHADASTAGIPVILVTALTEIADLERGFLAGALDYVRKPFNPRELLARVHNALSLKRSTEEVRRWKDRVSRELDMAGRIQRRLLSTAPLLDETFDLHMAYRPSESVGGDLFDSIRLEDGRLAAYVCDVAGHGVGPALVSSLLKGLIEEILRDRAARGPAAVCREVARRFRRHVPNPEMYATMFLALRAPDGSEWRCMNCGHPPPVLVNVGGATAPAGADSGGPPIGMDIPGLPEMSESDEFTLAMSPGSVLFIYTDGLIEAQNASGEDAAGWLMAAAADSAKMSPVMDPASRLMNAMTERGFDLSTDDCTVVSIVCTDPSMRLLQMSAAPTMAAVESLAAAAERALIRAGWPADTAWAVRLLLMEHGANVVEHGAMPPGSPIRCRILRDGELCRVDVIDRGREWTPAYRPMPAIPSLDEGGRGLNIIAELSDRAARYRRGRENIASFWVSRFTGSNLPRGGAAS